MKFVTSAIVLVSLFLGGCSTYHAISNPKVDLKSYHKIFVINNLDDNHRIDLMLVQALKEQGRDVDSGPPTMQPDDIQAVITYQDHWSWDFSDHLVGVGLEMHDARNHQLIGTAIYSGPVSLRTSPQEVIRELIVDLFNKKPGKKAPVAATADPKK